MLLCSTTAASASPSHTSVHHLLVRSTVVTAAAGLRFRVSVCVCRSPVNWPWLRRILSVLKSAPKPVKRTYFAPFPRVMCVCVFALSSALLFALLTHYCYCCSGCSSISSAPFTTQPKGRKCVCVCLCLYFRVLQW